MCNYSEESISPPNSSNSSEVLGNSTHYQLLEYSSASSQICRPSFGFSMRTSGLNFYRKKIIWGNLLENRVLKYVSGLKREDPRGS